MIRKIITGETSHVRSEGFDSSAPTAHTPTQSRRMGEDVLLLFSVYRKARQSSMWFQLLAL